MVQDGCEGRMEMYAPLRSTVPQLTCRRHHTGRSRCRGELYGRQGISTHQLAIRYASGRVSTSHHGIDLRIDASRRWAIPVCMIFSWVWMRTRFHWTQYLVGFGKRQWHKLDNISRVFSSPVLEWDFWSLLTRYSQKVVLASLSSQVICL